MSIVGIVSAGIIAGTISVILASSLRTTLRPSWVAARRSFAVILAAAALLVTGTGVARAAIVPTVALATSANYSVLAGTTVVNTGPSSLAQNAGVSPGSAIVGFPPGIVLGVVEASTAAALQAQSDLGVAYVNAANRPLNTGTTGELSGLTLVGGVYNGTSNSPLTLNGTIVLDGQGDPNSVFIFQTGSTLITGSSSTVSLINGAQECNVFWQVGSSATLGTGSVFAGNILALTSITVTTGVTVHGRALARNGAVTLDTDVFTTPTCDLSPPPTSSTSTTTGTGGSSTTASTGTTIVSGRQLPGTGGSGISPVVGVVLLATGLTLVVVTRRRRDGAA